MEESQKYNLLFVDDEKPVLDALRRSFRKEGYVVHTCVDPVKALEMVKEIPIALIVSDYNMPQMKGTEMFEKISAIRPNAIRILLTGFGDIDIAMEAINKGKVYKFIQKPWNDHDLKLTVKQALKQYSLLEENKHLVSLIHEQNDVLKDLNANLEGKVRERTEEITKKSEQLEKLNRRLKENFLNTIRVFSGLMEIRNSEMGNHSKRVSETAKPIAEKMCKTEKEVQDVVVASLLHDIGKIGVTDSVLKKPRGRYSREDIENIKRHPTLGYSAIFSLRGLEEAALYILHHHEKFNGSGYPAGLTGDGIPLGARIIAVADKFDKLVNSTIYGESMRPDKAAAFIRQRAGQDFDPLVVQSFLECRRAGNTGVIEEVELEVSLETLQPSMVIARELRTVSGRLLMPKGTTIKDAFLEKIRQNQKYDPVIDGIYVYRPEYIAAKAQRIAHASAMNKNNIRV